MPSFFFHPKLWVNLQPQLLFYSLFLAALKKGVAFRFYFNTLHNNKKKFIRQLVRELLIQSSDGLLRSSLVFKTRFCKRTAPYNCSCWINNTLCSNLLLRSNHYQVCIGTNTGAHKPGADSNQEQNSKFWIDKVTIRFT